MMSRVNPESSDHCQRKLAAAGLAVGGILGMAGTFAPSDTFRGLAWGIDGVGIVMAGALLALHFFRRGNDFVAAGYLVFAIGEALLLSGVAMDPPASSPGFGGGVSLWATGLILISMPRVFPLPVRILGIVAGALFAVTALKIFSGTPLNPLTRPLPYFAYPVLVATFFGWIWDLLKDGAPERSDK